MTHSDFNHLLSSLKALSPGQCNGSASSSTSQLAQPKKPPARTPGKAAKRARPAAPGRSR